jgi:hypothetical protein
MSRIGRKRTRGFFCVASLMSEEVRFLEGMRYG